MVNKFIFSAIWLVFPCFTILGQVVAPYQLDDKKAKKLNERRLNKIMDVDWVEYKRVYHIRETTREYDYPARSRVLRINSDHTFQQADETGEWSLQGEKLLVVKMKRSVEENAKAQLIMGGFAVYKTSKKELVLAKALSSTFDNKIMYYLERRQPAATVAQKLMETSAVKPVNKLSNSEVLSGLKDKTQEELADMVRIEFFMRNIQPPEGFEDMAREKLIDLLTPLFKE